jgi:hypothetical protein
MWKIVVLAAALTWLAGCSNDNQIRIVNKAQGILLINFRATEFDLLSGADTTIKDVPNGTYEYATTFGIPFGAKSLSVSGDAGAGSLTFNKKESHHLMLYSSTILDSVYTVYVNSTSSDQTGAAKVLGPR